MFGWVRLHQPISLPTWHVAGERWLEFLRSTESHMIHNSWGTWKNWQSTNQNPLKLWLYQSTSALGQLVCFYIFGHSSFIGGENTGKTRGQAGNGWWLEVIFHTVYVLQVCASISTYCICMQSKLVLCLKWMSDILLITWQTTGWPEATHPNMSWAKQKTHTQRGRAESSACKCVFIRNSVRIQGAVKGCIIGSHRSWIGG